MIDRIYLEKYEWQYIILDEGHRIKNRNCRLVKELKQIRSVSRLLLTGTPIQNCLEELWSLLNFVNPNIFDDLDVFQSWFGFRDIGRGTQVTEILEDEQEERVVSKLHEILRPFLLRRMKKDVLFEMPEKREIVLYAGMTPLQKEYYTMAQHNMLREGLSSIGLEHHGQEVKLLSQLMNCRKVCNHPFLFGEPIDPASGKPLSQVLPNSIVNASGKFRLMDRLLRRLHAQGHKVLLFSQMTKLLDIVEDYMNHRQYSFRRLDGQVKLRERQQGIDEFNSDSSVFCYLLSTRAGGLGINLIAADTIVIFDSDWNPHVDSQAMDRCHRIGQKKPVMVYRLLTSCSVEISMMERQIRFVPVTVTDCDCDCDCDCGREIEGECPVVLYLPPFLCCTCDVPLSGSIR